MWSISHSTIPLVHILNNQLSQGVTPGNISWMVQLVVGYVTIDAFHFWSQSVTMAPKCF